MISPLSPHHNQQLFSDHYLNVTLVQREDWMSLIGDYEVEVARKKIAALFKKYKPSEKEKEAQTEEEFVKPVLKILGHTFTVQASLATPGKAQTPDYIFYRDKDAQEANKGKMLNETLLASKAFAIGDAKSWNRPLDRAPTTEGKERDLFTNKNPTFQIAFYIQHSGLDWGILTNGRLWRLYHKDTAHKLDHYYEVDLPELLEHGSSREFLYFYLFFRRAAFDQHPLSVSNLLKVSAMPSRNRSMKRCATLPRDCSTTPPIIFRPAMRQRSRTSTTTPLSCSTGCSSSFMRKHEICSPCTTVLFMQENTVYAL